MDIESTIGEIFAELKNLPTEWEGKASVLELKEADYNWRQMEWWGFYFEYKAREVLRGTCEIPGDRFGNVTFDVKRRINFDFKAAAVKSDNHRVILNDTEAMQASIKKNGMHGEIIGLCDVEYNDADRSFQKWHTELKGGLSKYEKDRIARDATSRYRKTRASLVQILLVVFRESDMEKLDIMKQGRNSDGSPRKTKYMLGLDKVGEFKHRRLDF